MIINLPGCICLDDMSHIDSDGPAAITLPCGHRNSCEDCIASLIGATLHSWAKCPICRSYFKFSPDSKNGSLYEACDEPERFCLQRFESAPASHYEGLRQAFLALPRPSPPDTGQELAAEEATGSTDVTDGGSSQQQQVQEVPAPLCVCGERLVRLSAGGAYAQDSEGCQCDVCGINNFKINHAQI